MKLESKYYRDFYGGTASIRERRDKTYLLTICDCYGNHVYRKSYPTVRGARISLGRWSDAWKEC